MKLLLILILGLFLTVPLLTAAQTCPAGQTCLTNPLEFIGVKNPSDLIIKATQGFATIMGIVAVAFLVFSGFKLVIAANEEAIKGAKESITWSVGGFALSVLAFTIVSGAARILGFQPSAPGDTLNQCGFLNVGTCGSSRDFVGVLTFLMTNFLGLVGLVTIAVIIYYGYRYVTAAGNEEGVSAAKTGLKWAIAGFVIVTLAFTLISGVQRILFTPAG